MMEPQVCVFLGGCWSWRGETRTLLFICSSLWAVWLGAAENVQHFISSLSFVHDHYSLRSEGVICRCKGVIRRRSSKQNSFVSRCIGSPGGVFFFVCFITTCPWKKCVTFPVCMFLYVCACLVENTLNLFSVTPGEKDRGTNHSLLDQTEIQFSLKRRWLWTRHDANSATEYPVNCFFFFCFLTGNDHSCCFHLVFWSEGNCHWSVSLKPPCKHSGGIWRLSHHIICFPFTSNQRRPKAVSRLRPERRGPGWQKSKFIKL